jgi:hypothetical protein
MIGGGKIYNAYHKHLTVVSAGSPPPVSGVGDGVGMVSKHGSLAGCMHVRDIIRNNSA